MVEEIVVVGVSDICRTLIFLFETQRDPQVPNPPERTHLVTLEAPQMSVRQIPHATHFVICKLYFVFPLTVFLFSLFLTLVAVIRDK